ncbi:uncharacterized protein A4U43_UnF1060 [Asparagus officinalis]|uniref:Uncharacterized protein n=1 Tax=Asparagus officinalis TaxID=4686 RepID=A0A1R3L7M0_ASPOF|nr:GATA transcription factor 27-like [Asparagus officinalis]ONK55608.1 uncharacterized protein A4U43_UnF1060 [Asparagus officinalis]
MGKHGPCCHCGVTTTPLWRNGPPDKPVLCNACGSRWRTKGSLINYTPLHARELIEQEGLEVCKVKPIPVKPKEKKLQKIKQSSGALENKREIPYSDQNFRKMLERDTSNWSSSGSATSYSESCAHFATNEVSDLTGSAQSNVWDPQVPSKRRTCVVRQKPTPVEKLTKDLYIIMHEQQSSYLSSSEEDLLYEGETPVGSFEIGNGSVLLRYPNTKAIEEESEASSLPKSCIINEDESKGTKFSGVGMEKFRKPAAHMAQCQVKRDKSSDRLHILQDRDSPLCSTDLKDIVDFEVLMRHMTDEEQQRLMKYLPSLDTAKYPESLRSMFNSSQFVETLSYFQQLLQEGIFDLSISGTDNEDYITLKRLVLQNFSRSTWVEHYKRLKDIKKKQYVGGKEVVTDSSYHGHSNFTRLKRSMDAQNLKFSEPDSAMRSPKRLASSVFDVEDFVDNDGTCFSPRTIFATPPERSSSLLCSLQFTDDNSDHGLLLDVPSSSSFPEAELLYYTSNPKRNNSSSESRIFGDGEESLSNLPVSSFNSQKPRQR